MGKGRKPTPKAILSLRGSRVRGPHKSGIDAPPGSPEPPSYLCDIGRAEWSRIVPMLEASKVMSLRHQHTLAAYCDALADMVKADQELKQLGATFMDDKGRVMYHPAWYRKKDSRLHMLRIAEQFGLTASALSRVSAVEQATATDEDAAILFG
jgi:P27 family predicted phage terminase small subunit